MAGYVEYKTIVVDVLDNIDGTLNALAKEGWRVHSFSQISKTNEAFGTVGVTTTYLLVRDLSYTIPTYLDRRDR